MSISPSQFAILQNRVTALDGVTSPLPSAAAVPTLKHDVNGLRTTLNQLTLTIQAQLNEVATLVGSLQATIDEVLGGQTFITPITVAPVSGQVLASYDATTGLFTQTSGDAVLLQTNDTNNGSQTLLNLQAGTNIVLTDDLAGNIRIDSVGSGSVTAGQITNKQTIRVAYTTNPTDATNQYANIPVTFSPAFADANYTISTDLEFVTAGFPVWQANHVFAAGAAIIDSNGNIQVTPAGGISGGSVPVWNIINNQVSPTDGGISDWVLTAVSVAVFIGIVKAKTASGFIEEITLSLTTASSSPITTPFPLVLHVTAWHD